jgi:hypothetical protein
MVPIAVAQFKSLPNYDLFRRQLCLKANGILNAFTLADSYPFVCIRKRNHHTKPIFKIAG